MENENEVIAARQAAERELKMDLAEVAGKIKAARLEEARLTELVDVYGQRAERPKLEATGRQIRALLEDETRIEAKVLEAQKSLGDIYRRDVVSKRLASENQLSDAQRERLKADLESGASESDVSRRAAKMRSGAPGALGVGEAPEDAQVSYLRHIAHSLAQEFGLSSSAETGLLSSLKRGALSTAEAREMAVKMYLAQRSDAPGAASEESEFSFAKPSDVEW